MSATSCSAVGSARNPPRRRRRSRGLRSRGGCGVPFAARARRFSLVCSGGPTARICYEELAHVERYRVDWELVDIYMGDERCVPPDDPEANQRLVRESLIDRVGHVGSFHPMSCEAGTRTVRDADQDRRRYRPRPHGHGT